MDFGIILDPIYPYKKLIRIAQLIEELGFSSIWYPDEKFFRECYVGLSVIATNTEKIKLGTCVTDPYSRHPIMTAAAIGSIAEIAYGRTWLGFGAGGRGFNAMGISRDKPVVAIREAVEIVRKLFEGEVFTYKGEIISLTERKLDFVPPSNIPIFIATGYGEKIQKLGGEIGDATMIANYSTPETIMQVVNRVREGAKLGQRKTDDLNLISRIDVAVNENGNLAEQVVSSAILSAIRASFPNLNYLSDIPEFLLSSKLLTVIKEKDYETRKIYSNPEISYGLIPEVLLRHMAIAGTPQEVKRRLLDLVKMGCLNEIAIRAIPSGDQTIEKCISIIGDLFQDMTK